jgi:hypothetical protein
MIGDRQTRQRGGGLADRPAVAPLAGGLASRTRAGTGFAMVAALCGTLWASTAEAQCPIRAEVTEIRLVVWATIVDYTAEIDTERFRTLYEGEHEMRTFPTVHRFVLRRTWVPGDPALEIPIYAVESSDISFEITVSGTCIGELVQVAGPIALSGNGAFNCATCTASRRYFSNYAWAPYFTHFGRAQYHLYAMTGELLTEMNFDLEVVDARIRVTYGPGPTLEGRQLDPLHTQFGLRQEDWPTDLDTVAVPDAYSTPIISRCFAGQWTFDEFDAHVHSMHPLPRPLPQGARVTDYVCQSFAQCHFGEAMMDLHGDIPQSLLDEPSLRQVFFIPRGLGTYTWLEFVPTKDEIGEWDMVIECADNEGNRHMRRWIAIVEEDPRLRGACFGCNGLRPANGAPALAFVLAASAFARRRKACAR